MDKRSVGSWQEERKVARKSTVQLPQPNRQPLPLFEYGPTNRKQTAATDSNRQLCDPTRITIPSDSPQRGAEGSHGLRADDPFRSLRVSVVSGFAMKIGVKPRDITRHRVSSKFTRNSLKINNWCTNYSTHFCEVPAAQFLHQSATVQPRFSRRFRISQSRRQAERPVRVALQCKLVLHEGDCIVPRVKESRNGSN